MPRLPNAILFDLDDTIISAYGRPELAWSAVIAEFAGRISPVNEKALLAAVLASATAFWSDPDHHRAWRQKLREARREIVARGFAELARESERALPTVVQHALADRFSDYRDEQMHIYPDALATIDALRERRVKLALITNGDGEGQRAKIARFDLAGRFDHIQIEGEQGFGKPEPRAYRHAMESLNVHADKTWIVGDNLEWEVIAPQKLGIHAIWYDPNAAGLPTGSAARPDRVVRKLSELLE